MKFILKEIKGIEFSEPFPRMTYADAMTYYGIDKPDIRFEMKLVELADSVKGKGFAVWDNAPYVVGICAPGMGGASKKELDELTKYAKSGEVKTGGLVYISSGPSLKSTIGKFYTQEVLSFLSNRLMV